MTKTLPNRLTTAILVPSAASTTATDGRRVYAIFANGDVAAIDFDGNVRWAKSLGLPGIPVASS